MVSGTEQPRVPDPSKLSAVQKLMDTSDPYACGKEIDALFVAAMREAVRWHQERSPFFRRLMKFTGFHADEVQSIDDCARIPSVHANYFKTHEVLSVPREQISAHFTSSGTTGQKSQIFLDDWSAGAGERTVGWTLDSIGFRDTKLSNYLLYTYEIDPAERTGQLGTASTDYFLTGFAPVQELFVALRSIGEGRHEFDVFGAVNALRRFADEGLPVRILGFPAFMYFTLERMRAMKIPPMKLSPESWTFFGGGWKGNAERSIPKHELYAMIEEQLGIPNARCRDSYGSVEHSVPYIECKNHHYHVPIWSRLFARDVKTLERLPHGTPGFAHFVSAHRTTMPVLSIVMGDLVSTHEGASCGCGIERPYFEILGRAGTSKNRSCAIAAADLLKGKTA